MSDNGEPSLCKHCGKIHFHKDDLCRRKRNHNVKILKCNQCHKEFLEKGLLEAHMNTHTELRPLLCDLCPTTFSDPTALHHHKEHTHHGKKYCCPRCKTKIIRRTAFMKHVRAKHPEIMSICTTQFLDSLQQEQVEEVSVETIVGSTLVPDYLDTDLGTLSNGMKADGQDSWLNQMSLIQPPGFETSEQSYGYHTNDEEATSSMLNFRLPSSMEEAYKAYADYFGDFGSFPFMQGHQ